MNIADFFRASDIAGKYYRFYFVTNYSYFLGFVIHTAFIFFFDYLNIAVMVNYNIFSTLLFFTAFLLNRKTWHNLALILIIAELPTHASLATHYLGWGSGFFIYLMALIPLVFFNPAWNNRIKIFLAVLVTSFTLALKYYSVENEPAALISEEIINNLYYLNTFFFYIVLSFLTFYYSLAAKISEDELQLSHDKIDVLARTDPLTQLANRRDIKEKLEREAIECEKHGKQMAIILTDIDAFKLFNDQHGHDCGDHVLVCVADVLSQSLRHNDYIGRWGGEEFIIILPDTGLNDAMTIAEKIRTQINLSRIEFNKLQHKVSMTFGVSICTCSQDVQQSIIEADQALLSGKQAGKNQVRTNNSGY